MTGDLPAAGWSGSGVESAELDERGVFDAVPFFLIERDGAGGSVTDCEFAAHDGACAANFGLHIHDGLEELFGAWRTSRDVHIHGDEAVDALDHGVSVEDTAGAGAGAHGDAPLRFWHLEPDSLEDGQHFHNDAASHDEQVALAGAEPHDFGAEAGKVVAGGRSGHELNAAAGRGERHRPQAVGTSPVCGGVKPRNEDIFREAYRHRNTPFRHA